MKYFDPKLYLLTYAVPSELFRNFKLPENAIKKICKELPLKESLSILSFIDKTLFKNRFDFQSQNKIIDNLFEHKFKDKLISLMSENRVNVFFHPQQIYYSILQVIKYGNRKNDIDKRKIVKLIGILLFFVNEKCKNTKIPESNNRDLKRSIIGHLWQLGNLYNPQNLNLKSELARTYILNFDRSKAGEEISKLFYKETGITLKSFFAIIFCLSNYYRDNNNPFESALITTHYFKNLNKNTRQTINNTLKLISANRRELIKNINSKFKSFGYETLNFYTLKEIPIIRLNRNEYFCLSSFYLYTLLTQNLRELIKSKKKDLSVSQQIGDWTGKAYQEYIQKRFSEVYNSASLGNRFYVKKSKSIEVSDGIVDYTDELIFIEIKASSILKKLKISDNLEDIEKALEKHLVKKGAKQLDSRIKQFMRGEININNIDSSKIRKIWPILIICEEEIPLNYMISDFYNDILKKNNLLQESYIGSFSILNIREIEAILELVIKGKSFVNILKEKYSNPDYAELSFWNYFYSKNMIKELRHECFEEAFNKIKVLMVDEIGFKNP